MEDRKKHYTTVDSAKNLRMHRQASLHSELLRKLEYSFIPSVMQQELRSGRNYCTALYLFSVRGFYCEILIHAFLKLNNWFATTRYCSLLRNYLFRRD